MHVGGITMDLNWLLQFIFTVFVIGFGLLHLVKNTASKYFEAAESNHTVIDPCTVNQAMEAEEGCCRCVNCGSFGTQRCSRCKSVIYCSLGCQKEHWKAGHKLKCKDFGASSSRTAKSNSKPLIEKPGVTNPNFWEDPVRGSDSHNGWGAAVASTHSAAGGGGWMDEAPREDYNGWGAAVASTHSAAGGGGWMDEAPREDDNGWGAAVIDPSIGNQAMEAEEDSLRCVNCGNSGSKTCSRCKSVRYCSLGCQKEHWKAGHKLKCKDYGASSSRTAKSNSKPLIEKPGVTNPNFWEDPVCGSDSHNGWGAAVASTHSAAGGGGWMDEAPREDDNGWGAAVIDPSIGNQAMEAEEDSLRCVNCGNSGSKTCSRCKSVRYCSLGCQKEHWKAGHKLKCKDFGASSSRTAKSNSKPLIEKPGVTNPNFWEDPVGGSDSHNGWGAAVASTHSAAGGGGWMDEAPREDYNGWGAAVASTHSAAGGGGWMDEAPREDDNGWGAAVIDPSIGNQAMEAEEDSLRCVNCGNSGSKTCSRCKSVRYCSLGCQKKHWKAGHRLKCKDFGASSSRTAKSNSKPLIEKPGVTNPNFWEDPVRGSDSHNGWGAAVASTHSAAGRGGWMDEAPREDYNGWGAAVASTHSAAGGSGWMDEAPTEDYNGWGAAVASTHSTAGSGGWMDEAPREDYNGWGVPNMGPSGSQGHVQTHDDIPHVFETSRGNTASAPPIPDGAFDDEPIHHPSIDFSPPDLSVPAIELGASVTSDHVNEGGTSSCIICWEAPVEGACIPCGHMAGCMACLSEIKAKKGVCPVCRSNINQVLRLYAV